jgi:hypothetical protein
MDLRGRGRIGLGQLGQRGVEQTLRGRLGEFQQSIEDVRATSASHVALADTQIVRGDRERQRAFGADSEHEGVAAPA